MRKYRQTESADIYNSECEVLLASPDELSAYIDKELPAWKRHLIGRHLKKCGICADRVQRLQQTDGFLRHAGGVEVSGDFLSGVMARVSEVAQHQRQHDSLGSRVARFIETSFGGAAFPLYIDGKSSLQYSDAEPCVHLHIDLRGLLRW